MLLSPASETRDGVRPSEWLDMTIVAGTREREIEQQADDLGCARRNCS